MMTTNNEPDVPPSPKRVKVTELSWSRLCEVLMETDNVPLMQKWMNEMARTGAFHRALRIHGRMNGVRRQQEIAAIKALSLSASTDKEAA